jgi:hypothetical protein
MNQKSEGIFTGSISTSLAAQDLSATSSVRTWTLFPLTALAQSMVILQECMSERPQHRRGKV